MIDKFKNKQTRCDIKSQCVVKKNLLENVKYMS